jgi:2-polyprenyl-6-methoxyphenol hydroxylase-like FAD-dependent oxidoreductase
MTPGAAPADPLNGDALAAVVDERFPTLTNPVPGLANVEFSYQRVGASAPASLRHGRVVLAGRSARASRPGGLLGPTLGLEDAWVLADELAFGPADASRALASYESRRRDRARSLQQSLHRAGTSRPTPEQLDPVLAGLWRSRALAFSHVLGDPSDFSGRVAPAEL